MQYLPVPATLTSTLRLHHVAMPAAHTPKLPCLTTCRSSIKDISFPVRHKHELTIIYPMPCAQLCTAIADMGLHL